MTTDQKYKIIKKRLGINNAQVAEMFGYKNPMSFANAKGGKGKVVSGFVATFELIAENRKSVEVDFWRLEE